MRARLASLNKCAVPFFVAPTPSVNAKITARKLFPRTV